MTRTKKCKESDAVAESTPIPTPPSSSLATLTTRDGLVFFYRDGTSDIKAIREACGNIDMEGEKKRSSSYERKRRQPMFQFETDDIWLDCGAQIGSFTLRAVQRGVQRVIAVEPERENWELLRRNVTSNTFDSRVTIEKCAIVPRTSSPIEVVTLYKTSSTYKHTLITPKKMTGSEIVSCQSVRDMLQKYPDTNAVKLDIEGSEPEVIKSVDWAHTQIDKLVFEYSFDHHPVMDEFHDLIDILKKQFATVYHVPSLPGRGSIWDVKVTRGANGHLVWCVR
jgi:FkbM family methyltransferase